MKANLNVFLQAIALFCGINLSSVMKKIHAYLYAAAAAFSVFLASGCYSFQGISIPPDVNTYYVELFEPQVEDYPPPPPPGF
jgi:hypothetical protein